MSHRGHVSDRPAWLGSRHLLLFDYLTRHAESVLAKDYSRVNEDYTRFIDTLRFHGITPLVVFDGERFLPKTKHVGAQRTAKLAAAQTKHAGGPTCFASRRHTPLKG